MSPDTVKKRVFISYASADRALADQVCADLEATGFACWIAPRDVPTGADYAVTITEAIGACQVLVLLLSATAAASEHIEREVHLAASAKASIVPLRLEPIEPAGALKYLLANVQYLDAFPRLEPQLSLLRSQIERLLAAHGTVVAVTDRSPFQHVLASVGAWTMVVLFEALVLEWMHRSWFNLLPFWQVPLATLRAPAVIPLLAFGPLVALAAQYWAHRNLSRLARLDALFATRGDMGARVRLGGAIVLCIGTAVAIGLAPPTLHVRLADGAIDGGSAYVQARNCLQSSSYTTQAATHYVVELRIGSRNPAGTYTFRTELAPYATQDGVEFCEVWLDQRFGTTTVTPMSDDNRSAGYIEIEAPIERIAGRRSMLFNVRHYRDSEPSSTTTITASVIHGPVRSQAEERVALPLR